MKRFTVICAACFIIACIPSLGQNSHNSLSQLLPNQIIKPEQFNIQRSPLKDFLLARKTQVAKLPITKYSSGKLKKVTYLLQEIIIDDTCKVIYKYNDKMNEIENRSEILHNGKWQPLGRVAKTYDADSHLIMAFCEEFQNDTWENFRLDKLSYDTKGNFTKEQNYSWRNNAWLLIVTDSMNYDEENRLISDIVFNYNENGNIDWEYILKYTYDKNGNQLSEIDEGWKNGVKEYYTNEFSTYDNSDNRITYEYEQLSPFGYFNKGRWLCDYDTNNKMIRAQSESWESNAWRLVWEWEYFYDKAGNCYLTINNYHSKDSTKWTWKEIKAFDERRNCLTAFIESLVDSNWSTTQKTTYVYNAQNKNIKELREYLGINGWVKDYQYLYEFDNSGNLLVKNYKSFDNLQKENGYTYQYKYDGQGCLIYADYFSWIDGIKNPDSTMLQLTLFNKALNRYIFCHYLSAKYEVITGVNSNRNSEITFGMEQNYPNPFNPATKINYSIPEYSNVTLKIFDITGKELYTLVNEFQPAGNHSFEFNNVNLASGVYFYRLYNRNNIITKKMIILR